jgi:hypothetical protein
MKIISGLKWNDDLLNKTSLFYKNETVKIVVEVIRCFLLYQQILRISANYIRIMIPAIAFFIDRSSLYWYERVPECSGHPLSVRVLKYCW